jgi:hypothetical protein
VFYFKGLGKVIFVDGASEVILEKAQQFGLPW